MARFAIGDLRHRIRIEAPSTAQDASTGEPAHAWILFAERWAAVESFPSASAETFEGAQRIARARTIFSIRHLAGVVPRMRIVWEGRPYDVVDVARDGRSHDLTITAEELVEVPA